MLFAALAALSSAHAAAPDSVWRCRNQVEVWCAADGCAAAKPEEFTPMDISADSRGRLSVCAYSGCWEAKAKLVRRRGRALWAADNAGFSTQDGGGAGAQLTLLIIEEDGVGFVRVGGLATPLLCAHEPGRTGR
ncbi:MAG: hypothetical protein GC153_03380 [Alphaproteobacteria bacterium]|nr:hypothetical protein [Alphaproteobacteria bacterium]